MPDAEPHRSEEAHSTKSAADVLFGVRRRAHSRTIEEGLSGKHMSVIPEVPFFTERFSSRGGGIDFLGLRQVNLHILETYLIPGVNNQTADFGSYCLATWIPWK